MSGRRPFFRTMQISKESDEETWPSDEEHPDGVNIFEEIEKEYNVKHQELMEYKRSKMGVMSCDLITNAWIDFLDDALFEVLTCILGKMLSKAMVTDSLQYHKSTYNPMDFLSEYLWNLNPKHPERHNKWVDLFDMDWVIELLIVNPRPTFPFSWLWSKSYAALKIQSYMRGYWVRRRTDVQEVRQFWKALEADRLEAKEKEDARPRDCKCKEKNDSTTC